MSKQVFPEDFWSDSIRTAVEFRLHDRIVACDRISPGDILRCHACHQCDTAGKCRDPGTFHLFSAALILRYDQLNPGVLLGTEPKRV